MLTRQKTNAVTGIASAIGGGSKVYMRLLGLFASSAVSASGLARLWASFLLEHPLAAKLNGRVLLVVDGIKVPRSGRRMPAVKKLYQSSESNTKPEYIQGHSMQSVALLVRSINGVSAIPVFSRILEGLKETPRDTHSQLDRLPSWLGAFASSKPFYLVADAYYASGSFAKQILNLNGHIITRARSNAVAYEPPEWQKKRGRPRKYGKKIVLRSLAKSGSGFLEAKVPIYGNDAVRVSYKEVRLLWKPSEGLVKFILVNLPHRGDGVIYIMTTDLDLDPIDAIMTYALRFKIEVAFKSAVHTMGSFAYHFWTKAMPKRKRNGGDQYTHKLEQKDRERIWGKFESYHVYLQAAAIAQGITQIIAAEMPERVMALDTDFRRTVIPLPSEATVKKVLEKTCRIFSGFSDCPKHCVNQMMAALLAVMTTQTEKVKERRFKCV